jgi:hypothetical protein
MGGRNQLGMDKVYGIVFQGSQTPVVEGTSTSLVTVVVLLGVFQGSPVVEGPNTNSVTVVVLLGVGEDPKNSVTNVVVVIVVDCPG